MDEFRKHFGRTVQHWRKLRGLTQEELAERTDLSLSHLNAIEGGRKAPSFDAIKSLAAALGIAPRELFDPPAQRAASVQKPLATLVKILETQPKNVLASILDIVRSVLNLRSSSSK